MKRKELQKRIEEIEEVIIKEKVDQQKILNELITIVRHLINIVKKISYRLDKIE
jgi:hypothetical protein